jgi:hypothetical protein
MSLNLANSTIRKHADVHYSLICSSDELQQQRFNSNSEADIIITSEFEVVNEIVHVLDPKRTCNEFSPCWQVAKKHLNVMKRFLHRLCRCVSEFFDGWMRTNSGSWPIVSCTRIRQGQQLIANLIILSIYRKYFDRKLTSLLCL